MLCMCNVYESEIITAIALPSLVISFNQSNSQWQYSRESISFRPSLCIFCVDVQSGRFFKTKIIEIIVNFS